ncbi:hypothetical protein CPB84DRAFT_1813251 [Gymnopilus junonius]|uniref:Probable RNA polymerase II nuclear localization protein SLC7A6OS n=1 Tax=Gymnopilus junonius TaxID=109634 RepID=A0A9P5NWG3_GYMJU|nr:hypothetical protein CPB84DRAFT_1813251 [Gymnopilus junonius]
MQVDLADPAAQGPAEDVESKSYTILRIKRKRNEEPLDALVVESRVRRKKSRGGVGMFQYAQTVENDAWDDAQRQKNIQVRGHRLVSLSKISSCAVKPATMPSPKEIVPLPAPRLAREDTSKRYTIVDHEEIQSPPRRYPIAPPKVVSVKELERRKQQADFKMYDAVPTNDQSMVVDEAPSEMDKFLPMLQDYLKSPCFQPVFHPVHEGADITSGVSTPKGDNDYVWDVFYHRPATLSEWNEVANVGTVTGLPPSFGDDYDSASDSDEELDEADEDSNAEEYYKNDYPEEEESDEFHDDSDQEDVVRYLADADDQCDDLADELS